MKPQEPAKEDLSPAAAPLSEAPASPGSTATARDFDRELKELDVISKQQELDAKKKEWAQRDTWLARWNSPVALAVLAGLVGYLGTLITWSLARVDEGARHDETLQLEKTKQAATERLEQTKLQGTLILDAMKTGDGPDKGKRAAANLLLLADAKLITLDEETQKKLKERAGDVGPGLPSPVQTSQPLEGGATSDVAKALNRLKNRSNVPNDKDIAKEVSLAALLAPGNDVNRFDDEKAASISGYVVSVRLGGKTSANFFSDDPNKRDTNIMIAPSEDAPANQQVVAIVTWRLREQMKTKGIDWSTQALQHSIKGKWTQVTGWLLFNTMHINSAENTNPGHPNNWRATSWELHPVTDIRVTDRPPPH
jgi:hypothetical protein